MLKITKTLTLFAAAIAVLAGCGQTSSSITTSELTEAEKQEILQYIATSVPLVTEAGTGTVLYNDEVTDLKDGRDLYVVTKAVRREQNVTITWSYKEGVDGSNNPLATFEFLDNDETTRVARPEYPTYQLVLDGSGNDISVIPPTKVARLYANLALGETTLRVSYDMYLRPQLLIEWKKLDVIRDTEANAIVGARGYITSIYPDYDAMTIQEGDYALTLYKTQAYSGAGLQVGDFIEAAGSWRPFNGLAEIGYIKRLNKANPADFGAQLPTVHTFSPADFKEWADALTPTEQFLTSLYDFDSARIKIDEPMTILRAEDRNATVMALSALPVGNTHANVILGATVGGVQIEIKLSLSYHIGTIAQQAIKDKLVAAGVGASVKFNGILSWYNEPVLGPMNADNIILA